MKRFRTILALILTLSLAASIIAITTAETVPVEPWQADLRVLMDDSSVPRSTSLKYDVSTPENAQTHRADPEWQQFDCDRKRRNRYEKTY